MLDPEKNNQRIDLQYETVIGLEVHVQLQTKSKMFCSCRADYQSAPANQRVCPVCLGLPGTLPVINRKAVEYTIMTGLALNCSIPEYTKFDRKNYPYPDLMKGYQISQYDLPLALEGHLDIQVEEEDSRVGIERVHLEEDVAKLHHHPSTGGPGGGPGKGESYSLVDVNRSGVPLMEVVSKPDMRSPEQARAYLTKLHTILQYLNVSTANMQDGSFRCDANISLRPVGASELGTKAEIKNLNSFRSVFLGLKYEEDRQRKILEDGGRVNQETRGWAESRNVTFSQRSKEYAHDYRYFPDPDLPPLTIDQDWVEEIRSRLPELASQRGSRFVNEYGLPEYDAGVLTSTKSMADFFEEAVATNPASSGTSEAPAKSLSNWILGDLSRLLNAENTEITRSKVTPGHLVELVGLVDAGEISNNTAKMVLEDVFNTGTSPAAIVKDKGYSQIDDSSILESAVSQAIEDNPKAVDDFRNGKDTAARFLVGQVMRITKGQAKPDLVNQLVQQALEAVK